MQVEERGRNLVTNDFGAGLWDREFALFEVGEEVTATQVLHHDIDEVLVLKDIQQTNYVRVLTHFKNFDFSSLQFYILHSHFLLAHDLDSDLVGSLLMNGRLDESELALAQWLLHLIEVSQRTVPNHLPDRLHPLILLFLRQQVIGARLVRWEDQLKWMQNCLGIQLFGWLFFDKDSD